MQCLHITEDLDEYSFYLLVRAGMYLCKLLSFSDVIVLFIKCYHRWIKKEHNRWKL